MVPLFEEAHSFQCHNSICVTMTAHFSPWRGLFAVPVTMEVKYSLVFVDGFLIYSKHITGTDVDENFCRSSCWHSTLLILFYVTGRT